MSVVVHNDPERLVADLASRDMVGLLRRTGRATNTGPRRPSGVTMSSSVKRPPTTFLTGKTGGRLNYIVPYSVMVARQNETL